MKFEKLLKTIFRIKDEPDESKTAHTTHTGAISHYDFDCSGLNENYIFDFYAGYYGNHRIAQTQGQGQTTMFVTEIAAQGEQPPGYSKEKIKIAIKPKDVLQELETIPNPFTLQNIDEKIVILEDKASLIKQQYTRREVSELIERMKNRKKYQENAEFFNQFNNTTTELIDKLLKKYELVLNTSDIFIPEFPDEAITTMKAYEAKCLEITEKKPVFYVIATEESFKKTYDKRDPILLVQSPFGFYWQILGAWDKEMILLSEL